MMRRGHHLGNRAVAPGGHHELELVTSQGRTNGFDVRARPGRQHDAIPAELPPETQQPVTEGGPGARQRRVDDEQDAPASADQCLRPTNAYWRYWARQRSAVDMARISRRLSSSRGSTLMTSKPASFNSSIYRRGSLTPRSGNAA